MRRPDAKGLDPAVYHRLTAHLCESMGARETLTGSQDQQPGIMAQLSGLGSLYASSYYPPIVLFQTDKQQCFLQYRGRV